MKNIKADFPFFLANPNSVYFDSGATSLKPNQVIEAQANYLKTIGANPHSNDYQQAIKANEILTETRQKVKDFLNAKMTEEIIFNSGATFGINFLVNSLKPKLHPGDEVWLTTVEHSSNLLPWIVASEEIGFVIKQIPLTSEFAIDIDKLANQIGSQTKIISFASVANTVGIWNDTAKLVEAVKTKNPEVLVIVDATQEIAHYPVDVQKSDVDFLVFSAHKMYGPFGLGVVYGKMEHLQTMKPFIYGGGNNDAIDWPTLTYKLAPIPARFEAGTPNISAIAAFNSALDYLLQFGLETIQIEEEGLKKYLRQEFNQAGLSTKIETYNLENNGPIFDFNVKGVNSQDVALFLANDYQIAVRSGAHCARTTQTEVGFKNSVRVSFGIYNTKEDVDQLIKGLTNLDQVYDHLFE